MNAHYWGAVVVTLCVLWVVGVLLWPKDNADDVDDSE